MDPQNLDLKKTLNLMRTDFSMEAKLAQSEPRMLERWEKEDLYGQIRANAKGRPVLRGGPVSRQNRGRPGYTGHHQIAECRMRMAPL